MRRSTLWAVVLLPLLMTSGVVVGQDEVAEPTTSVAQTISVDGVEVSIDPTTVSMDDLWSMLKPLTQDELVVEVEGWQALVHAKTMEISQANIASRAAEGTTKDDLIAKAGTLTEERSALLDRMDMAVKAFESKGGDGEGYRTYMAKVATLDVPTGDLSGAAKIITTWLTSEEGGIKWAINIGLFIGTLLVFKIISSIVKKIVKRALDIRKSGSELLENAMSNIAGKAVMIIGLIVAISMLGVNVGPLAAAVGAAGFIIGFAIQGTLSNFASGVMILMYRPYDEGDVVNVAGVTGKVTAMSLVSTSLTLPDNQTVIIPNSSIWGDVITNVTGNATRRVDMVFGIGYDDDIAKAMAVMEEIITADERVLKDPAPAIRLHELADSSVNFIVRPWTKTSDYWDVYWDVTRKVKERFDAEGISIPYPQQDVHMHQVSG